MSLIVEATIEDIPFNDPKLSYGCMAIIEIRKQFPTLDRPIFAFQCHEHVHCTFRIEEYEEDEIQDRMNAWVDEPAGKLLNANCWAED